MTHLKLLALAAALSLCATQAAHADAVTNSYVLQNDLQGVPGVSDSSFGLTNIGNDAFTEMPTTHHADDTFTDDFYFNLAETSKVSFNVAADLVSNPGVAFRSAVLYTSTAEFTYSFATETFTPVAIQGNGLTLTTGEYALEVTGTTLVEGGSYSGVVYASPLAAVPEPANAALLLAGLGVVGAAARRRGRRAGAAA